MPDKKLTDAEIKKALEYCSKQGTTSECEKCKMPKNTCRTELIGYALDYINRLQAEKQDLEIELKAMRGAANSYKAENEKLKKAKYIFANVDYCADDLEKVLKENEELKSAINGFRGYEDKIKAEAYKEFAGLVIDELTHTVAFEDLEDEQLFEKTVNNLLKELAEKSN